MAQPDAVVIGSGPNGLAAAAVLARAGRRVVVYEAADTIGGGCRTAPLTLPGFRHDVCSAVHPFAVASPVFRSMPLEQHGLAWIEPPAMFAHPHAEGAASIVYRSLDRTVDALGRDGAAWRDSVGRVAEEWPRLERAILGPLHWPRHPLTLARFGLDALRPAASFARARFGGEGVRALFAGIAAHAMLPLDAPLTSGVGLALGATAHVAGWPVPRGGAQAIADALASYLRSLGGEIVTGVPVRSLDELPRARAVLCDLSPRPFLRIAGDRLPPAYRRALERYRYGMGVCKIDWALDAPIPWRDPACALAGTVHLGGTLDEMVRSERAAWRGHHADRPFVLLSQPSLFDPTRAPAGKHVAWTYCHVPRGSADDVTAAIEAQIERFAPGFGKRVLARAVMRAVDFERYNPNYVGGDIAMGAGTIRQFFLRPTWRTYSTPVPGVYLCSAATPPGVGVHGMCGYYAAQRALREVLRD